MNSTQSEEKPSALRNSLGVRVRVLRKTSDGEIEIASDLPSGVSVPDFIRGLADSISTPSISSLAHEAGSPSIPQQAAREVASATSNPAAQSDPLRTVATSSTATPKKLINEQLKSSDGTLLAVVEQHAEGKILVVPKVELASEDSTFSRFLKPKVLAPLAAKYPAFRYRPIINNALVVGLELQLTQEQWTELIKPLTWTLEKAEKRK